MFTAALAIALRIERPRAERPRARTAVGLALSFTGVLCLTAIGSFDVGAQVIALNCLSYSLYIVLSKRVIERVGALTRVTWLFAWGALILAPIGLRPLLDGAAHWSARGWTLVGVMVAVPTIVAYLANAWAPNMSAVAKILTNHPELQRIRIEGHTDSIGTKAYTSRSATAVWRPSWRGS